MNRNLPSIFSGIAFLFFVGWLGFVAYPYLQLGRMKPLVDSDGSLPPFYSGRAVLGAQVYAMSGCVYCHSQQIRQTSVTSSDIDRKWAKRSSVARDYLRDRTAFLGTQRFGPDLSNVGLRLPSAPWHYEHLYEPTCLVKDSTMPSYRYLFKLQKIEGEPSLDAITLYGSHAPQKGYEVVPTEDAKNLVAYLLSLKHDYMLPEVPPVKSNE